MEKVKLKDICRLINGRAYKQEELLDSGKYPVLRVGNFFSDKVFYYSDLELEEDKYCDNGDLLFAWSASFGPKIWDGEKVIYHYHIWKMELTDRVNKEFLFYYLFHLSERIKSEGHGGIMIHTTKAEMEEREFNLPTLEEQIAISEILNKVMSVIDKRKEELSVLDDLIKARFVEMFGDITINDKNWKYEPLGELCTIVRGGSPRPIEQFLGGDVPWIKIGDATDGDSVYLRSTKEYIIQEGVKKSRLVKEGSLIFANCGVSLGFARIITFDGCIHDGWLAMEDIDERLDKVFLLQALNQMTEHFRAIAPAGTQPNLNTAIMKAYKQVIPPIELQREFISFAKQVDKSKVAVQKALEQTQTLFDSLMQKYFG